MVVQDQESDPTTATATTRAKGLACTPERHNGIGLRGRLAARAGSGQTDDPRATVAPVHLADQQKRSFAISIAKDRAREAAARQAFHQRPVGETPEQDEAS